MKGAAAKDQVGNKNQNMNLRAAVIHILGDII
jgi:hypothetical protein